MTEYEWGIRFVSEDGSVVLEPGVSFGVFSTEEDAVAALAETRRIHDEAPVRFSLHRRVKASAWEKIDE